jgi:hypothetical protein
MKHPILIITLLSGLCFHPGVSAQQLSGINVEEKKRIIEAVLEVELSRLSRRFGEPNIRFEERPQLSSENIGPISSLVVSGQNIIALDAANIREKLVGGMHLTYLVFKSFEEKSGRVVVKLSRVTEQDTCFDGHHKENIDYIYVLAKVDNRWRAELKGRTMPLLGYGHL